MLVAQVFMLLVSAMLTVLAYLGLVTPWLLLAFTFLIGCGTALHGPAWQSSVGDMVPRSDLPGRGRPQQHGLQSRAQRRPGPRRDDRRGGRGRGRLCGECAQLLRADLRPVPVEAAIAPADPAAGDARHGDGAGLRYVAMSPAIRTVLLRGFLFGLAAIAVQALMPLVARDLVAGRAGDLRPPARRVRGRGVGGALVSSRVRQILSIEALVRCSFAGLRIVRDRRRAQFLDGADDGRDGSWGGVLGPGPVDVQRHGQLSAPRWVVGRALALYQTAAFGGMALGSWIWGLLAEEFGAGDALLISAAA